MKTEILSEKPLIKIVNADCLVAMKDMPDKSIDLVLTSPPYDNLRNYEGYSFDFENIAKELFRIIKDGGVMVWVVGDATINGSETGTSFKQALYFKEIGFNLHDTMIYVKDPRYPRKNAYSSSFEYMFIFTKGNPKTFNPILRPTLNKGKNKLITERQKDGSLIPVRYSSPEESPLYNVWYYSSGYKKTTKDKIAYQHPAIFPDKLAQDHIISWSNENDLILDPFAGSFTTGVACAKLNRNFIGIEISPNYCEIGKERIKSALAQGKLLL